MNDLRRSPRQPLLGMRILVTRPREQSMELAGKILELGGEPIVMPTIEILPPSDYLELDRTIKELERYDWLVFTSANGVRFFFERCLAHGITGSKIRCKTATVGSSTAAAVENYGLKVSFVPTVYLTEKLALELPLVHGKKILLARVDGAEPKMSTLLTSRGAKVKEISTYRVAKRGQNEHLGDVDAILLMSPSAVSGFDSMVKDNGISIRPETIVCCIGPVTAKAAEILGFRVNKVAQEHTAEGLLKALIAEVQSN